MNGRPGQPPMDLVKDYWTRAFGGKTTPAWTLRNADGRPFANVGRVLAARAARRVRAPARPAAPRAPAADRRAAAAGAAAAAAASPRADDRHRDRLPSRSERPRRPVRQQRLAAGAAEAAVEGHVGQRRVHQRRARPSASAFRCPAPATATRTSSRSPIRAARRSMPVWVMPGTADDVVVVHFGYGRARAGRVGTGIGVNTFATSHARGRPGSTAAPRSRRPATRYLDRLDAEPLRDGRPPSGARRRRGRVPHESEGRSPRSGHEARRKTLSLYPRASSTTGHKWGMAIDLNACTGCGVCVVACVAENNIPVVGKTQVERSREMHWLRVDTYFEGDPAAPDGHVSPAGAVPAVRERAVRGGLPGGRDGAQRRRPERHGLQPLRRHAVLLEQLPVQGAPVQLPALLRISRRRSSMAQRNPDVTIRSRGVMEKCTYCVQRINHARIDAKTDGPRRSRTARSRRPASRRARPTRSCSAT